MLRLWYSVEDSFLSSSYTKDELIDDIYAVLNEWGYQVTEETDNQVAFVRDEDISNTRTPSNGNRNYLFFTHKGKISFDAKEQKIILKLTYAVEYWAEIAFVLFAGITAFVSRDISSLAFFGLFPLPVCIYRHYAIRKKCKEILKDIISI
ncbi:hypothetical protein C8P68_10860 [Mucilaginibacter yixingensis]|uniref:Uncharacterized protein n=1 Tax=Mucilaginibacter yixingensis TaxID=1295612 RepID=A0A2T5J5Q0_9SPHI|nr:hypothetical protein [Mucilaginibacter yixingensis]PTQ93598.1 hypothetical protein C8P68_10860 [Mucilaginibacter yixingensis]